MTGSSQQPSRPDDDPCASELRNDPVLYPGSTLAQGDPGEIGLRIGALEAERRALVANAAHELRTPIAGLQATLDALRAYWITHRHPKWLFPARESLHELASTTAHVSVRTIQRGFKEVVRSLDWNQDHLVPHTLRHSFATAMLEQAVNLKVLQTYLGHKNLQATEIYLHLTRHSDDKARRVIEKFMNGPVPLDHESAERSPEPPQ